MVLADVRYILRMQIEINKVDGANTTIGFNADLDGEQMRDDRVCL